MLKYVFLTVTGLVFLVTGVFFVDAGSASQTGLVLDIRSQDLQGNIKTEFATNEPVWLSVELQNTKSVPISVWIEGAEYSGITCRPNPESEIGAIIIPRTIHIEKHFREVILTPGEGIAVDVLLNDFCRVSDKGTFSVECSMDLKYPGGEALVVKAVVPVRFSHHLDADDIVKLVGQLRQQFMSGEEDTRIRNVKSVVSCPSDAAMEFLEEAISDKSERVQHAVLKVLSSVEAPDERVLQLIRKAEQSDSESVRYRAAIEIEKIQGN